MTDEIKLAEEFPNHGELSKEEKKALKASKKNESDVEEDVQIKFKENCVFWENINGALVKRCYTKYQETVVDKFELEKFDLQHIKYELV